MIDANDVTVHCFDPDAFSWSTITVLDVIPREGLVKVERKPSGDEKFYAEYLRYPFGIIPEWELCKDTVVAICGFLLFKREYALMPSTVRIGNYTIGFGASGRKLRDIIKVFFDQIRAVTREFDEDIERSLFGEGML